MRQIFAPRNIKNGSGEGVMIMAARNQLALRPDSCAIANGAKKYRPTTWDIHASKENRLQETLVGKKKGPGIFAVQPNIPRVSYSQTVFTPGFSPERLVIQLIRNFELPNFHTGAPTQKIKINSAGRQSLTSVIAAGAVEILAPHVVL